MVFRLRNSKAIDKILLSTIISVVLFFLNINVQPQELEKKILMDDIEKNLRRHVLVLSKDIGERNFIQYQNLEQAADYIKKEFLNYGYDVREQKYSLDGKIFRNIIAIKESKTKPDEILIICAHYDSAIGSFGADDNASGVSGLLEIARLLQDENLNKTVKFIAFTNEEPPFFMTRNMGSFRYTQEAKEKKENILGVLCLESIGYYSTKKGSQNYPLGFRFFYPDKGNFIGVVGNFNSRNFLEEIVKRFKKNSNFPIEFLVAPVSLVPAISFSDHWSFWKFGYRAIMITDTAFYRSPYYHTPLDTYEKLDYTSMREVVVGLYKAIKDFLNE